MLRVKQRVVDLVLARNRYLFYLQNARFNVFVFVTIGQDNLRDNSNVEPRYNQSVKNKICNVNIFPQIQSNNFICF